MLRHPELQYRNVEGNTHAPVVFNMKLYTSLRYNKQLQLHLARQ